MKALLRTTVVALLSSRASPLAAQDIQARAHVQADSPLGTTSLSSTQATERPGALGEPARAVLDAPGAARSSFLGSELILWGAAPSESQTYVDGVQIPNLFHPAGLRTTVHPALIERVTLSPGALPADYGRSLGGAVDVEGKTLRTGTGALLRADGIDTSLAAHTGNDRVQALVGARYGYFDRVLSRLAPDSQGILATPSHRDGVGRLSWQADPSTTLSATWIGARDHVDVTTDTGRQRRESQFHVASLRLDRRYEDGARLRITPFFGFSSNQEASSFGGVPLAARRAGSSYGVRADYTRSLRMLTFKLGIDARGTRDTLRRSGTLSLPAREGDVRVFAQQPLDTLDSDHWRVSSLNVAPWTSLSMRVRGWTLTPSMRLESYVQSVSRMLPALPGIPAVGRDGLFLYPEPRLSVGCRASDWLSLEARTGLHHQQPDPADLSAVFGAPSLMPARAWQSSLGARLALPRDLQLDLVAFDKELHRLAVRTDQSPAALAEQLEERGRGSARGASLAFRGNISTDLYFSLTYTWSHAVRSDPDGKLRLFDYDQPHVLSTLLGYRHGAFVASTRLRVASGAPRTRVVGTYLDAKTGLVQPLFGAHNDVRLPTYVSLDVHAEYRVLMAPVEVALFADVMNATDHTNVEDYAYAANYQTRRNVTSIPIVAMAGLSVRWGDE